MKNLLIVLVLILTFLQTALSQNPVREDDKIYFTIYLKNSFF